MDIQIHDSSIEGNAYTIATICLWVESQIRMLPHEIREFVAMEMGDSFIRNAQLQNEMRFEYLRTLYSIVEVVFGKRRAADFILPKQETRLAQLVTQLYYNRYPLIQNPSPKFFGTNAYFIVPIMLIELVQAVIPSLEKELSQPITELLGSGARKWQHNKPSLKGDTWIWDGSRLLSEHDLEIISYTQQITHNPNNPELYLKRANVRAFSKKEFDKAIADYDQAIHLNPTDMDPYFWRGHAFRNKGQLCEAIDSFNEAIRLCPSEPGPREGLAICYAQQQDYTSAIKEYTYLLKLDPKRISWYLQKRAELLESTEHFKEAISDLQAAADLLQKDDGLQGHIAKLHELTGNPQQALVCYSESIEIATEKEKQIRSMSKEYKEPLRSQLIGTELVSGWYLSRGLLNLRLGNRDEAMADLKNFVSRSKNVAKVDEVIRMIKDMNA